MRTQLLSEQLRLHAEWWLATPGSQEDWELQMVYSLSNIADWLWTTSAADYNLLTTNSDRCLFCLIEAEYQQDLEAAK